MLWSDGFDGVIVFLLLFVGWWLGELGCVGWFEIVCGNVLYWILVVEIFWVVIEWVGVGDGWLGVKFWWYFVGVENVICLFVKYFV